MTRKKTTVSPPSSEGEAPAASKPRAAKVAKPKAPKTAAAGNVASLVRERAAREVPALPSRETALAQVTTELNNAYAVIMAGSRVSVLVEKIDHTTGRPTFDMVSVSDMRTWFQNKTIEYSSFNPATGQAYKKAEPKLNLWLTSPSRREYIGVTFDPTTDAKEINGQYNVWNGWGVKPARGDCSLILKHIRDVWCSGDEKHYEWVLDWCADLVQDPANKKGVAVVLKSGEGTGKGIIVNDVLGKIVGGGYVHLSNRSHFVGRFNSLLQGALLVFADEAIWAGDKEGEGALKTLITDDELPIEKKGKDSYMLPLPCRLIFASNEDWVVPAGHDSRRYFVLKVSEGYKQDKFYFADLVEEINSGGVEAFLQFLLDREITNNLRKAPVTEGLIDQRMRSADNIDKWWFEVLDTGVFKTKDGVYDFDGVLDKDTVHQSYLDWCGSHRVSYPASKVSMGTRLKEKLCPLLEDRKLGWREGPNGAKHRPYGYMLPDLDEARRLLEVHFGGPLPWSGGEQVDHEEDIPF